MAKEAQNDTVFREEQNHLDSTKAAIQSLLDGYEQKVHKGEKELSSGNRYNDKEDRSFLQNVRSNICENSSRAAFYKRIIPRPYLAELMLQKITTKLKRKHTILAMMQFLMKMQMF